MELIKSRLSAIKWFANVGKPLESFKNINQLSSIFEVGEHLGSAIWENTTLEAANEISGFLVNKHSSLFQHWNIIACEARNYYKKNIADLVYINGIDNKLLNQCVGWDITHFLIEDYYKTVLKEPLFFECLLKVYESGHLPCGWQGCWPKGNLIIY